MKPITYRTSIRAVQSFVFASPFTATLFDGRSGVPFPPLGDDVLAWRFGAAVIVATAILVPFLWQHFVRRVLLAGLLFILIVFSTGLYLVLESNYVLPITYPNGDIRFVTRGTARNPELTEPYRSMTDEELIRSSGQSDLRLQHVYSNTSLWTNRLALFASYVFSLCLLELFLGTIATLDDQSSDPQTSE